MKILLSPDPAESSEAAPPASAGVVANSKTERELELERELEITKAEKLSAQAKAKKLETDNAHLQDERDRLKQPPATPPAKEKSSWMGFS